MDHPLNAYMATVLHTKVHLLEAGELPDSVKDFLRHQAQFEIFHRLAAEEQVDTPGLKNTLPMQFETDVAHTLARLRRHYETLRHRLGDRVGRPRRRVDMVTT